MERKIGGARLALTFAGCFLGAGYVSGQELWQYFGAFGGMGLPGLAAALALLGGVSLVLLQLSARTGIETMDALLIRADIPWLRTAVGALAALLLFGVVCIMTAGIGALLEQMLGVPAWLGCAGAVALIAVCAWFGLGGMMAGKAGSSSGALIVLDKGQRTEGAAHDRETSASRNPLSVVLCPLSPTRKPLKESTNNTPTPKESS